MSSQAYNKEEFIEELISTPPNGCNLKVGDLVEWVNDYGVKWEHKVLGFKYEGWYHEKYNCFVHLDKDAFWFPLNHKNLKKLN